MADGYEYVKVKAHPAFGSAVVPAHRVILYAEIGPGPHRCHWCGISVDWGRGNGHGVLVADHVDRDTRNNAPANLVASCQACNVTRSREDLVGDDELFRVDVAGHRHRQVPRSCESCGGDFAADPSQVRIGRGRFCSRSCARRSPLALTRK